MQKKWQIFPHMHNKEQIYLFCVNDGEVIKAEKEGDIFPPFCSKRCNFEFEIKEQGIMKRDEMNGNS